jgi:phage terminase small subunit
MTDPNLLAVDGQIHDDDDAAGEGLNPREILFVDALALGHTLGDAAIAASISARSGRRWKAKPEIAAAIRVRMTENIAVGRAILAAGMSKAATGLVAMASGEAVADSARVSACRAVVENATKLVEIDEMTARLEQLEAQIAEHAHGPEYRGRS